MNLTEFSEAEKYTINKQVPVAVFCTEKAGDISNGCVDGY